MTPDDRALLLSLRQQQADLQQALERMNSQLGALEARLGADTGYVASLPPLPVPVAAEELPPVPPEHAVLPDHMILPPIPVAQIGSPLPPVPLAAKSGPSLEYQLGRWLIRMGALFGVVVLGLILTLPSVQTYLGHAGLLALSAAASLMVVVLGERLERKNSASLFFGRALTAMALAWLYLTDYAAYAYEPIRVIHSPLVAGVLLLAWSIYVLRLAERKQSQGLGLFAITLAYFSTAINPLGAFTMGADLILAATAVAFLVRHGWTLLTTFSAIGTYGALLRRLVLDENGEIVFDNSRSLAFWPHALYLVLAWFIFTVAVTLTTSPTFRGGRRLAFVSLNNGALAALLALAAYIAGLNASAIGWTVLDTGILFLVMARFAGFTTIAPVELMGAYAAQGLALFTAGIVVAFTGISRGVLLLIETLLLGIAGAFSGDRILTVTTYVAATFATFFLIWEIAVNAHHPWLLGFTGAAVMLMNAWSCRGEIRDGPQERSTIVLSSSCYCVMALGLIFVALNSVLSEGMLPPALAIAALVLTFAIYYVSIYELPALAQTLLLIAQGLVLFPEETGEPLPWWSTGCVGTITLLLVTWWSRQRVTRSGSWTTWMKSVYALALVGITAHFIQPNIDAQSWMIVASLLSIAFLVYGAFAQVWTVALMGQLFLEQALVLFFFPSQSGTFPWSWWAAAVPGVATYATARAALEWARLSAWIPDKWRRLVRLIAYEYLFIALLALVRWVFAAMSESQQIPAFLALGTLVVSLSVRQASTFGVRCSFVLSAVGVWLYLDRLTDHGRDLATFINGFAIVLFLCQSALLRHEGKSLITKIESWTLLLLAIITAWLFVSMWVWTRINPVYLTMSWALYALFLFIFGALVRDSRLRWGSLGIVITAIVRVIGYDMWGLSNGYRVLTFIVLTMITLGVGYAILRRAGSSTP